MLRPRRLPRVPLTLLAFAGITGPASAQQPGWQVAASTTVNVRTAPAGSLLGSRSAGSRGTVTAGPVTATLNGTSHTWWQVDWESGTDGWSFSGGLTEIPPGNDGRLYGVDVSRWQGTVDWPRLAAVNRTFAFCKATEGTALIDGQFTTNAANAPAAGIILGMYHFARPEENDALAEARHFASAIRPWLTEGRLAPVLDLESGSSLGKTSLSAWTRTFCLEMERLTLVRPLIYVNRNYAANFLASDTAVWPLWIAAPGATPGSPVSGLGSWSRWTFQQYSWTGRFQGIGNGSTDTDLNCFAGTLQDLARLQVPAIRHHLASAAILPGSAAPGTTLQLTLHTSSTHSRAVLAGASLYLSGTPGGDSAVSDRSGESPQLLAAGTGSLTRSFRLPDTLSPGMYDAVFRLYLDVNANSAVDSADWALTSLLTVPRAVVIAAPPAGFPAWAAENGLSGGNAEPDADPDHDGVPNLLEYAFATLPGQLSSVPAGPTPALLPGTGETGPGLKFTFLRPAGRPDLTWIIESSSSLTAGWVPLASTTGDNPFTGAGLEQTGGNPSEVRLTLPATIPPDPGRFLRLRVIRNSP